MKSIKVVSLCFGLISVVLWTNPAHASNAGGLPACKSALNVCTVNLTTCNTNLGAFETAAQVFPGDGYGNPDAFGVSGHGPALSYTDNGDGTFTDNNTKFIWELKTNVPGSVHNVQDVYTWSTRSPNPDGTLFTSFLNTLNNKCSDEKTTCTSNTDCTGIGNGLCGLGGHRDWRIPNVKELQGILDYSIMNPSSSVPGLTWVGFYWSATTNAFDTTYGWLVNFTGGNIITIVKSGFGYGRAVRP